MKQEAIRNLHEAIITECDHIYDCEYDNEKKTLSVTFREECYDNPSYFIECLKDMEKDSSEWADIAEICEDHGITILSAKAVVSRQSVVFKTEAEEDAESFFIEAEDEDSVGLKEVWFDSSTKLWYLEGHEGEGMTTIRELFEAAGA